MAYGLIVPSMVAAMNIDAYNRSVVCTSADIENGSILELSSRATGNSSEVWVATQPATATLTKAVWMAYSPEVVVTTSGTLQFKGIDPDARNFINLQNKVFDAFRVSLGDVINFSADAIGGSVNTYAVVTNGQWQLQFSAAVASGLTFKILETTYISLADGSIGNQRITSYLAECVALA